MPSPSSAERTRPLDVGPVDVGPVDVGALFRAMPTAYLVMTPDLVIADANEAYLQLLGRTREELVGRPVFDAFPPAPEAVDDEGGFPLRTSFLRARDSGRPDVMPLHRYGVHDPVTGEVADRYWSLISAPVLDEHGRTQLVLQRVEDVTDYVRERTSRLAEAERSDEWERRGLAAEAELFTRAQELAAALEARDTTARRLASLNEVALQLTAAATVEDLERIVVDRGLQVLGADGGAVVSPDGSSGWRVTINDALGERVKVRYGNIPHDSPLPAAWTARTGQPLLLPTRAAGLAFDRAMAQVHADTGRLGWAFLPLVARGERLGCLAIAWTEEHPLAADELELLRGFAAQCAQALLRIRATAAQQEAVERAQGMSEGLQRSLLTLPPTPDAVTVAVRYQPAAVEAQVGGDWYDAFTTSAGATLLVVGDVTGHDQDAAAAMGQVRNLLRGLAYDSEDSPGVLLSRLDAALDGLAVATLATAVLARLEQTAADRARGVRRLRWSSAGHPPPLLRRPDGSVVALDGDADLLLGLDPDSPRAERLVELAPGAVLLLYTDGLVERRTADLDAGIAHLARLLGEHGDLPPEALCDRLLEAAADGADDDVALLVLRVGPGTAGAAS